jgi:hypothetical protein
MRVDCARALPMTFLLRLGLLRLTIEYTFFLHSSSYTCCALYLSPSLLTLQFQLRIYRILLICSRRLLLRVWAVNYVLVLWFLCLVNVYRICR